MNLKSGWMESLGCIEEEGRSETGEARNGGEMLDNLADYCDTAVSKSASITESCSDCMWGYVD